MKLSETAKEKLQTRQAKAALMTTLGFSEVWINKCIKANKVNGPLTTISAIGVIKRETGLTEEEILDGMVADAK